MRPSRRQAQRYIPLSRCHAASTQYYNRCTRTHKHKSKRRPRQVANDEQACWTKGCKRYARCRHNTGESKLERLFDAVKAAAKQFRQRGGTDGRAFWQPLKQRLSDTTPESLTWKRLGKHLRERVLALAELTHAQLDSPPCPFRPRCALPPRTYAAPALGKCAEIAHNSPWTDVLGHNA